MRKTIEAESYACISTKENQDKFEQKEEEQHFLRAHKDILDDNQEFWTDLNIEVPSLDIVDNYTSDQECV